MEIELVDPEFKLHFKSEYGSFVHPQKLLDSNSQNVELCENIWLYMIELQLKKSFYRRTQATGNCDVINRDVSFNAATNFSFKYNIKVYWWFDVDL